MYPDNDKDGIRDSQDEDDDNDGILDSYEGNGDNDQDGIPNKFDPDSDGDGCLDVIEAGFIDQNGDSIYGPDLKDSLVYLKKKENGTLYISSSGRVNYQLSGGKTAYSVPNDLDGNGIYDFLEEGAPITEVECPDSVTVAEGGNAIFSGNATAESGTINYQWEISKDSGTTWSNVSEPGLMFVGIGQAYRSSNDQGLPKFIEFIATKDIEDLSKYMIRSYQDGSTTSYYKYEFSGSIKKR